MAPKAKKKKKTKEEIEEERRQKAEAARLAEEERLRKEEEERIRRAKEEEERQNMLAMYMQQEQERLDAERQEQESFLNQVRHERIAKEQQVARDRQWERYLSCNHLPHPENRVATNDYISLARERPCDNLADTLRACHDCVLVADEAIALRLEALYGGRPDVVATCEKDVQVLHELVNGKVDAVTAHVLHHMDQYANEVGEVQLAAQQAGLQWGIWVNVSRNPRLKSVAWPEMRLSAEVPKSLTLAPVTIRVQRREWDEFFHCWRPVTAAAAADATGGDVNAEGSAEAAAAGHQQQHDIGAAGAAGAPVARVSASGGALAAGGGADASTTSSGAVVAGGGSVGSSNEFMAVGGVFTVDLLGIPPAAKKTKGWVMRNVTPLAAQVQRIPYPIPPAGADPATWRSEEEPPPFRFTLPLSPDLALFDNPLKVGWWDADACSWSQQGITDVAYNRGSGMLSFSSTHLAPMAVIQSRTRVLPYKGWTVRPLDGLHSRRAEVALHVGLKLPLTFEVGPGYVSLSGPEWPELGSVLKQSLTPWKLLHSLAKVGLHLMPEDRDAPAAGVTVKAPAVEDAMCANVAMLCGAYLLAGSKWNQSGSDQECICRVSQILDWEEGGRTEALHVERIFGKEKLDGPRKVLSIIQRGTRGVAFCDCFDQHESFHALPGTATLEEVKIAMDCVLGEVHANSLALLTGNFASPSERDGELARGLKAREDNLDVIRSTDPLLTQTLAQLLKGLRVFSFS